MERTEFAGIYFNDGERKNLMSEQKRKIGFTVACVNEFADKHGLTIKEAFQYLFRYKGIAFLKKTMILSIRWILK